MLLVSFLLVIVATIFLLSGLFLTRDLPLIIVSIVCSALAGIVLIIAVLRSRPRPAATAEGPEGELPAGAVAAPQARGEPAPARSAGGPFPIPDYDSLEVVEVLPLLGDLEAQELEMVRQREASGRAHPWVLARIDALLEAEAESGELEMAGRAPGASGERRAEAEDEEGEWDEAASEWARSEWAASDFPLEGRRDSDYDQLEVMREFPIDGYESLRANEVLPLLSGLDVEDLKMVREEEAAGKARTSILSRIDTLLARHGVSVGRRPAKPAARTAKTAKTARAPSRGPSKAAQALPIENYDSLTVVQITSQLARLSAAELKQVRTYEKRHKARAGVLQKIEGALQQAR